MKSLVFAVAFFLVAVYAENQDEGELEWDYGPVAKSVLTPYEYGRYKEYFKNNFQSQIAATYYLINTMDILDNKENSTFKLKTNEYISMPVSQWVRLYLEHNEDGPESDLGIEAFEFKHGDDEKVPESFDWMKQVDFRHESQGGCASSYAIATVKALEMHYQIKTGRPIHLSTQEIIDCSGNVTTMCNGGSVKRSFEYIMANKGLTSGANDQYAYSASQGPCKRGTYKRFNPNMVKLYKGPSNDEEMMKKVVSLKGPVVTRMDIDTDIQFYGSGVFQSKYCKNTSIERAVVVVGYGKENGLDYWLILTDMGTGWGQKGLMKVARNKGNHCGIGKQYYFPELAI